MRFYVMFSLPGQGYQPFCLSKASPTVLSPIKQQQMPRMVRQLLMVTGAKIFLGQCDEGEIGCIRDLPTHQKDENGRDCFLHVAFLADGNETALADAIIQYVLQHLAAAARLFCKAFGHGDDPLQVDVDALEQLYAAARSAQSPTYAKTTKPIKVLVPETTVSFFFAQVINNVPGIAQLSPNDIDTLVTKNGLQKEVLMDFFIYCSSPLYGYVLKKYDLETGQFTNSEQESADLLGKSCFNMITGSGAQMLLGLDDNGSLIFMCKQYKSRDRSKCASLFLRCLMTDERAVSILQGAAIRTLCDHQAFRDELLACVDIYPDARGFVLQHDPLIAFLDTLTTTGNHSEWKKAFPTIFSRPTQEIPYACLVVDPSIREFNEMTGLTLTKSQIAKVVTLEEFQAYTQGKKAPVISDAPVTSAKPAEHTVPVTPAEPAKHTVPVRSAEPAAPAVHNGSSAPVVMTFVSHDESPVDLLKTPWFKVALCVFVILVLIIVLHINGNQPAAEQPEVKTSILREFMQLCFTSSKL